MPHQDTLFLPASARKFEDFGFLEALLAFKPNLSAERFSFGALITIDDGLLQQCAGPRK